jgi:hypothetical protein
MDTEILNTFIGHGPWALLLTWLLVQGMKDTRDREAANREHLAATVKELRQLREDHRVFFQVLNLLIGHELQKRGIKPPNQINKEDKNNVD